MNSSIACRYPRCDSFDGRLFKNSGFGLIEIGQAESILRLPPHYDVFVLHVMEPLRLITSTSPPVPSSGIGVSSPGGRDWSTLAERHHPPSLSPGVRYDGTSEVDVR
jgi:hypothetical protein